MTERRLFLLGAALALGLYLTTASGLVTWSHFGEDGPELEGAARTLGVAHPPGYPLFTIAAHVLGLLLPLPWSAVNALTLLAASATVGMTGILTMRVLDRAGVARPWVGGLAGLTFMAIAPVWWKQASIGEVYTVHMALIVTGFLLLLRGTARDVLLAAYVFGLGLAHHPLTLPALLVALLYGLIRQQPLRWLYLLALCLPLTLYGVLLVRSAWQPAFDWGEPRSMTDLWWVMSGAPYHQNLLRDGWQSTLGSWSHALENSPVTALGWGSVPWVAAGGVLLLRAARPELLLLLLLYAGSCFVGTAYQIPDSAAYFLPGVFALAVLAGAGVGWGWQWCERRPHARLRVSAWAALLGIMAGSFTLMARTGSEAAESARDSSAYDYALAGVRVLPRNALVLSRGDGRTFSLWYGSAVLDDRPDVAVVYESLLDWPWYRTYLASRHPDLLIPPRAPEAVRRRLLLSANLDRRPVFVTEVHPEVAAHFGLYPAGPLVRVREPVIATASSETRDTAHPPRPPK